MNTLKKDTGSESPDKSSLRSYSPMRLACLRLGKNKLAICGMFMVSVMVVLVVFGPLFCTFDPAETRPWIKNQPPGFTHLDCRSKNIFIVGEAAETSKSLLNVRELLYEVRDSSIKGEVIHITLRRGRIDRIWREEGAQKLKEFDLSTVDGNVFEKLQDGTTGRALPRVVIKAGDKPPEGFFPLGDRVLILEVRKKSSSIFYKITQGKFAEPRHSCKVCPREDGSRNLLKQGLVPTKVGMDSVVTGIEKRKGEKIEKLDSVIINGSDVVDLRADGKVKKIHHLLGTDGLGRDLFARILSGGRISLLVGVVATLVSLFIGVIYGAVSGYCGEWIDRIMMGLVDILYGLPFIFLVLLLMVVFERNIILLFVALGCVQWLTMARIVRGQILSLKKKEFVEAARMCGARSLKIIFQHLIPHTIGPIIVYATITIPIVILEESFLAFIGLPVQYQGTNLDSWGSLVHLGTEALGEGGERSWLLIFPSLAMIITLFGLNCLGDGLRDVFDPRAKT